MSDQPPVNLFYPKVYKATKAVWHLRSKNKKWCDEGPFLYKGMKGIPLECSHRIEQLKVELKQDPPEDLEWGYTLSDGRYLWVSFKWWLKGVLDWVKLDLN